VRRPAVAAAGDQAALAAFLGCALITAVNPVAIRFSNRELAPLWGAGLRLALMAALLVLLMRVLRLEVPRGRALRGALLYGALGYGCAVGLTYYGLVHVHAGLGQLMFALVPLATLLVAALQGQERVHARALAGASCALAGVAVLAQAHLDDALPPLSLVALLGSVLCVAQAAVVVRRFPPVHVVTMNALATFAAALVLVPAAFVAREPIVLPRHGATLLALAFGVVGGSLLFVLYVFVLKRWAASRAAYLFVLAPFLTFVLSARLDDEPLGPGLVVGGAFIVAGVYVGALRQSSSRSPAASSAASRTTSPP
jgi:drug/metabolite transporter (DMT)-like permease